MPHNITSLLGVMDGASSDLRQGLPLQGMEIHEPMRVLFLIETTPEAMLSVMAKHKVNGRILGNSWSQLAVLNPETSEIHEFRKGEFHAYHPEKSTLPHSKSSLDWYAGYRENLEFAEIDDGCDK